MIEATRWLHQCRDYDIKHTECSLALVNLYLHMGLTEDATQELFQNILTQDRRDRSMVTHFKHWQCEIPLVVMDVLLRKGINQGNVLDRNDAKYTLLMVI